MKKIVFFIVLIIILFSVPITVYLVGQQQELRSRAAPATTLVFNPGSVSKNVGDVFSLDIQIDTGENNVAIAELHLTYDVSSLEALSITNGPAAPLIAASGVVGSGTASISVRAESSTKPITGTGTIAIVRFKALGPTTTPVKITFATTTFVSGLGESQPNVLVGTTPATVTIQGSQVVSPTPTAPASPVGGSNAASPTPTLMLTPTPSSTPSAEASSSAIQVTVEQDESGMSPNAPLIQGKAPPGSTVTIVIHSDPITVVVTTDENGNYHYTPTQTLTDGIHTIVVTSQNPDGTATSSSSQFTVSGSESAGLTEDAMPASGTTSYTLLLITIAFMIFVGGMVIL